MNPAVKLVNRICAGAIVLAFVAACKHDPTPSGAPPGPGSQRGALLQSPPHLMATYSVDQMLAMLGGNDLGRLLVQSGYAPVCAVSVYHLEYQTVDPAGKLTPASGALMVPGGTAGCEGARSIVEYAHGTQTDKAFNIADLSAADNAEGVLLAAVFAAEGYVVVAPNYVGYDTSTLGYHPYLVADQQAADMIDALAAGRSALPVADQPGTTAGAKLFVTGYSQGGYVAMAAHRAMQAAGMPVTAAAPLSGPYALSALGDAIFEGQVNLSATVNVALLASSYQRVYGNLYASSADFFSADYAPTIESLLPSTMPLSQLVSANELPAAALFSNSPPAPEYAAFTPATSPAVLASVFAQGFAAANFLVTNGYRQQYLQDALSHPDGGFPAVTDGLPPAAPGNGLRTDLKRNDLRTWTPSAPVLLCGGGSDPDVFFFNTQLLHAYWTANAAPGAVTVLDVDSPVTADDPQGAWKTGFSVAKAAVAAAAVAGGAIDGGAAAVLADYHAGLVAPFCLSAARAFFDAH